MKEPVLRATVVEQDGSVTEYNNMESMAPIIAASNQKRQSKSVNTPFMVEPLVGSFGFLANKANAIKVSLGQFEAPEGTDPYAVDLIKACKMPDCIKHKERISLEVTPDKIAKHGNG